MVALTPSADLDRCRRRETVLRHFQVLWCRSLPDAGSGVVHRSVTRAEIAAVGPAVLAFTDAQGHATEMRAHTERDQPVGLAGESAFGERLRIAQRGKRHCVRLCDLLRRQVTNENRLLAPADLDALPGLYLRNVDLDGGQCED